MTLALITGGAGFIGRAVTKALSRRNWRIRVLDSLAEPVHVPTHPVALDEAVELVKGDVRDPNVWPRALANADVVVHLAAQQDYLREYSLYTNVNVSGTALLYESVARAATKPRCIVIASSQAVYGEGLVSCPEHGVRAPEPRRAQSLASRLWDVACSSCGGSTMVVPSPETFAAPTSMYGASKLAMEHVARVATTTLGIRTVMLRYSIVHGVGQSVHNAYSGVLRAAASRLLNSKPPVVFEDGQQKRDYVSIDDVVSATLLSIDDDRADGPYNVGGDTAFTVDDVITAICGFAGYSGPIERNDEYRVGDSRHSVSDCTRLKALGWKPSRSVLDVWPEYWQWIRTLDTPDATVDQALSAMRQSGMLRSSSHR